MKEEAKQRHGWRENLEALTMAVVVALLFKYFILEISKIPSGSMQPTLMGAPEAGVNDRVLVDKLSFHFRDPERFEIVVFKHPLERSRVMVKRLVGMPGEELKIQYGDVWVRPDASQDWSILRRPRSVQDEMWRRLDPEEPERPRWKVLTGGTGWRVSGRDVEARGDGRLRYRPDQGPVRDGYLHGYDEALAGEIHVRSREWGRNPVGDLRVEADVRAAPGLTSLLCEITEGRRSYRFRLPGPAAGPEERAEIRVRDSETGDETAEEAPLLRLESGSRVALAFQNLDDLLSLELDGETVLELEIPANPSQEASITFELSGEGAELSDLVVYRDIFYLPAGDAPWTVEIPEGHYVMLGDNTQDSADSRDWEAVRFRWEDDEGRRGNYRAGGENPTPGRSAAGTELVRFRDEWGEHSWFSRVDSDESLPWPAPLVPRELLLGRCVAVFWPLAPHRGFLRLAWLH